MRGATVRQAAIENIKINSLPTMCGSFYQKQAVLRFASFSRSLAEARFLPSAAIKRGESCES
jgi:hypothetical protein